MKPTVRELAADYEGRVIVATLDVDAHGDLVKSYGVEYLPTTLFFLNGEVQGEMMVGYLPKDQFAARIDALLAQSTTATGGE